MDSSDAKPATSSAVTTPPSLPSTPLPSPRNPPPPDPPNPGSADLKRPISASRASIGSALSSQSHQEYLNSLVLPTKEQFAHIAEVQAEREAEHKRHYRERQRQSLDVAAESRPQSQQSGHHHHAHFYNRLGFGRRPSAGEDSVRARAATVIQRTYRGYRTRRELKGLGIDASTRWIHAVREAQWRQLTTPRARSRFADGALSPPGSPPASGPLGGRSLAARQNWKKVSTIARHAGADVDADASSSSSSLSSSSSHSDSSAHRTTAGQPKAERKKRREEAKARRKQEARMMGLQYFLEMVDLKHRYGANLRAYHEEWKKADTNENFFYWLDHGEGRFLDIEACPRERLERERVRYLSREERQYYLVKVDNEGRLCWAKNGARIDTSEKYKDSIHGIVPSDDPTPPYAPEPGPPGSTSSSSSPSSSPSSPRSSISPRSSDSSFDRVAAARYAFDSAPGATTNATTTSNNNPLTKKIHHVSATTILNTLLRKTVRKNTWIFVADTSFRLYVGLKRSGAFQHSSFLSGSRIAAAGLIRIRDGQLRSLSPLSGHYRPPASNFRAFVRSLREAGVDMRRVSVSKSYAVLVGLEVYVKSKNKVRDAVGRITHAGKGRKRGELEGVVVPPAGKDKDTRAANLRVEEEASKRERERDRAGEQQEGQKKEEDAAGGATGKEGQQQQQQQEEEEARDEEEAKMREENQLAAEVMQKLSLGGGGPTEPKGQKGDGDRGERAPAAVPPAT